ncbi:glycosyltransferase family 4 protein [Fulvivirga maritima]|nr:glycosyltransferase family 4 protein [Fulvivirga maritima]UII24849.1 glycosyltransferase family 4 protein [Fulvivirga maritima]
MRENGFEVITTSADGVEVAEVKEREGVSHIIIPFTRAITPFQDLKCLRMLVKVIKEEAPDIVHSHTPKAGLLGMMAAKIAGIKHRLHTVAGLPLMEATGGKRSILKFTEAITYACASKVYPNSYKLQEYILNNLSINKDKLKVIGKGSTNGIDLNVFNKSLEIIDKGERWKSELNIPNEAFVYLFIGRIVGDKGINELVKAFIQLNDESSYLVLVGPLEELDPLSKETMDAIANNKNIIAPGFQSDVRPFLAFTDVFVFPSYREGFPNVVLQASAMGVPTIASDINGCNEIINHEESGLLIPTKQVPPLYKAMQLLRDDERKRTEMAGVALKNVHENYDQQFVWSCLIKEYKELLHV